MKLHALDLTIKATCFVVAIILVGETQIGRVEISHPALPK